MSLKKFFSLASLILATSSTDAYPDASRDSGVSWGACEEAVLTGFQCANFTVPVDYTAPESNATLDLQLLRVPAVQKPKRGTIFFNLGGPGLEARVGLANTSATFLPITGGEYDLVAYDPRGTANTLTASCFNTSTERASAINDAMTVVPALEDTLSLGRLWGQVQVVENACSDYAGFRELGSLVGTSFVARDLMQLVDAIEEDGLLRFWGISYGTVLGATVAAMFPERVDRMVLDAVFNAHEYFNSYDIEPWAASDETFFAMLEECIKAGDLCALSQRRSIAKDLEEDIYNLLEDLRVEPLVSDDFLIDSGLVRTFIRFSLYSPVFYPALATGLEALLSGNATAFAELYKALAGAGLILSESENESPFAILCGDKSLPKETFPELTPTFEDLENESRLLGQFGHIQAMICQEWRIESKERYEGDFNVETRHPLLVIGNSFDPATPLVSASNISEGFEGSVVLEHGGFGHGSTSHGSACTINAIRSYFSNGALPETGTVCEVDYALFEPATIADVLTELGYLPPAE